MARPAHPFDVQLASVIRVMCFYERLSAAMRARRRASQVASSECPVDSLLCPPLGRIVVIAITGVFPRSLAVSSMGHASILGIAIMATTGASAQILLGSSELCQRLRFPT